MMSNIPKLRFKEFTGEWEEKKLSDIVDLRGRIGWKGLTTNDYVDEGVTLLGVQNITKDNRLDTTDVKYIPLEKYEDSPEIMIEEGHILLAKTGATIGKVCLVKKLDNKTTINAAINLLDCKDSTVSSFLVYELSREKLQRKMWSLASPGAQPNLFQRDTRNITIMQSSKEEQEKIASFLTSVDTKIEQLTKKEELLKQYKKGVMQKIFSQEIRFQADDGSEFEDWEEKALGEILDYEQPTRYIVDSTEYDDSYETPVLTAGKTFILGYTDETEGIFKDTPVIIFDDFTTSNNFVDFDFKVKSSAMKILKLKPNVEANIKLVYEFMQKVQFPMGEHKRYWISEYQYMNIPFPCLEEQTKIANFLSSIDSKIEQAQKQLVLSKEFKKALLQQMFV